MNPLWSGHCGIADYDGESVSSNYVGKIDLTNQHSVAMGSLSNFLHTANHVAIGSTTPAEFAQMWWRFKQGRAGELNDDTTESFTEGIQSMSEGKYYCLSLLSIWERAASYWDAVIGAVAAWRSFRRRKKQLPSE